MRISDWSSDVCSSDLAGVDKLDRAATRSRRVDDIPPDRPDARILETRRQRQVVAEVEIMRDPGIEIIFGRIGRAVANIGGVRGECPYLAIGIAIGAEDLRPARNAPVDRKSTRLNSSH